MADPKAAFLGLIMRYRFVWTGGSIGTGYTALFGMGTASQAFADGAYAMINAAMGTGVTGAAPSGVTVTPDSFVDILSASTGELSDSQGVTASAPIVGSNSNTYAAPSGACITWTTAGFIGGHRVRGRTFFVPISSSLYDTNGTLKDSYRTTLLTAANTYRIGSWAPCVWHRPIDKVGGQAWAVSAASVRDRISLLTSRR